MSNQRGDLSGQNIVLVGMMGSGKTSVGQAISAMTGMSFVDTDDLIEDRLGMTIPAIFSQHGEPFFRTTEEAVVGEAAAKSNSVIATGGGVILKPTNMMVLKKTGFVVYLHCGLSQLLERIKGDEGRPLLSKLEEIFAVREPLYNKYSDFTVNVEGATIDELAGIIYREYSRSV